jgi:hypothetical protein
MPRIAALCRSGCSDEPSNALGISSYFLVPSSIREHTQDSSASRLRIWLPRHLAIAHILRRPAERALIRGGMGLRIGGRSSPATIEAELRPLRSQAELGID